MTIVAYSVFDILIFSFNSFIVSFNLFISSDCFSDIFILISSYRIFSMFLALSWAKLFITFNFYPSTFLIYSINPLISSLLLSFYNINSVSNYINLLYCYFSWNSKCRTRSLSSMFCCSSCFDLSLNFWMFVWLLWVNWSFLVCRFSSFISNKLISSLLSSRLFCWSISLLDWAYRHLLSLSIYYFCFLSTDPHFFSDYS